jgi:hypothetical protein
MKTLEVVVDFDGSVVTHEFPHVGKDIGAAPVLKELVAQGHKLILFTMRCDSSPTQTTRKKNLYLTDAVNWFKENDIPLYGIQRNPTQGIWTTSPKAHGDIIIDDIALGCPTIFNPEFTPKPYVDWVAVRELLVARGALPALTEV